MLALAKNENKLAISCVLQGQVCNLLDFLCLSAFACIDVRTGVETHTHTTDAITYVFVSQHLFALLSASDNRVCVNDIPDRTHTTPPELWRGKAMISLKDCREVNTEEFLLTDHPSFIPGFVGLSISPLCQSLNVCD